MDYLPCPPENLTLQPMETKDGRRSTVAVAREPGLPVALAGCSPDVMEALLGLSGPALVTGAELAARAGGFLVPGSASGKPLGLLEAAGETYVVGVRADGAGRVVRLDGGKGWAGKALAETWRAGLAAGAVSFRLHGAEAWLLSVLGAPYDVVEAPPETWPRKYDALKDVKLPGGRTARDVPVWENSTGREEHGPRRA